MVAYKNFPLHVLLIVVFDCCSFVVERSTFCFCPLSMVLIEIFQSLSPIPSYNYIDMPCFGEMQNLKNFSKIKELIINYWFETKSRCSGDCSALQPELQTAKPQ